MKEKSEIFLISITVFEGRHYAMQNMDSYVLVRALDQKKCTKIYKRSDCPYYNEYFTFEFKMKLQKLLDNTLTLTVLQPANCWRKKKILGYVAMDIATVWDQPDHQFYHKWAVISAENFAGGPRGYLKVDIAILTKDEVPKMPIIKPEDTDVIEGNLLLPEGMTLERQRANFVFKIYRGEDFLKQLKCCNKVEPNVCIEVLFVGLKGVTSVQKSTVNPNWNESLTFTELFPPLCQRIKITIKYMECLHKTTQAAKYINLRHISNDQEYGFLPTFGPAFMHFYLENNDIYAGKLLLSLETILYDEFLGIPRNITVQNIKPLNETELWLEENVLLFSTIFEISHIPKDYKDKPMRFEIHFGNTINNHDQVGDGQQINKTLDMMPISNDNEYWYLELDEQYPCLTITSVWPDFRRRFYLCNMINRITDNIKAKMSKIEVLFKEETYDVPRENIQSKLIELLDLFSTSCRKFLDIIQHSIDNYTTTLDKERLNLILREMKNVELEAKDLYNPLKRKRTFRKLTYLYQRLEYLLQEEQECYPDVFLWVVYGGKRLTYVTIKPRDIIYSMVPEEKGRNCGLLQDVFFKTDKHGKKTNYSTVVCKVNLYLWLGVERHKKSCFADLPENFTLPKTGDGGDLPTYLTTQEKHIFQCRAYIYQGRINPGDDSSGLSDPFVRVIIKDYCKKTRVLKKSLNPLWDQTILFQDMALYGSKRHVQQNPPNVILEIFDRDYCKEEFVGRALMTPNVILSNDSHLTSKLSWVEICNEFETKMGEILCAAELYEITEVLDMKHVLENEIVSIPVDIKPKLSKYRIEILFWGFRNLRKINFIPITRPYIVLNCLDTTLKSKTIHYNATHLNFCETTDHVDVELPEEDEYAPPITIKLFDSRSFGRNTFGGIYVSLIKQFKQKLLTEQERNNEMMLPNYSIFSFDSQLDLLLAAKERQKKRLEASGFTTNEERDEVEEKITNLDKKSLLTKFNVIRYVMKMVGRGRRVKRRMRKGQKKHKAQEINEDSDDDEYLDWWTKYYASLDPLAHVSEQRKALEQEKLSETQNTPTENYYKLRIYDCELEAQPEFNGFTDMLQLFPIYKGKRSGDEAIDKENITGYFKGALKIYKFNDVDSSRVLTPSGYDVKSGAFQEWPSNEREPFVVRVYCVRGLRLISKDTFGKSDAYISVKMGRQIKKFRDEYIPNQFNPVFGKCVEMKGFFPSDHSIIVSLIDRDKRCSDDLIGETRIDIENRFYTKHRARCGLAKDYVESGYSSWRGQVKPTHILESYCKLYNASTPIYTADSVVIGNKEFAPEKLETKSERIRKECIALHALHHWFEMPLIGCHLVPEHVETRSLYHPAKPGIEQGKLEMWVDIFPCRDAPTPSPIDITPRKPISYELRVIIWNTEDVMLSEDDFFTGEKKSDIFVKGWMSGENREQCTDVHYRSLTGEGNFNWRFVFSFDYLTAEKKIVKSKKSLFDEESEEKYPCKLRLQIWDNDTFSRNDFLGSVSLELSRLPRAAKSPKKCTLTMLNSYSPKVNLFKIKRTKGWWPFRHFDKQTNEYILAGKVEAELELVTQEEADVAPAGMGRDEPKALPKPNRPETSFSLFKNPLKALKYLICKLYKWKIVCCCTCLLMVVFVLLAIYSFPGYAMKRILGA